MFIYRLSGDPNADYFDLTLAVRKAQRIANRNNWPVYIYLLDNDGEDACTYIGRVSPEEGER